MLLVLILYVQLYICWCDHETYSEVTKPRNGSVYPWPLNHIQTWSKRTNVIKRLKMLSWYEKTLADVYKEVENCCQALTDRLEDKAYFFGDKYVSLCITLYSFKKCCFPLLQSDVLNWML